ncbi:hypothetical protein AWC11_20690 [Mycobacterium interjectum]|nr:hypothetical protein AWC11_20690 [Mycobacterium interjectum]
MAVLGTSLVSATEAAGNFQASQTRLVASAGETTANLRAVHDGILQLSGQVGYSAQDLMNAMYGVEKAGYRGADGVNVLRAASQGAKSENSELKEVLNGLTTSMNDFGYKSDDAADVMSKMVTATSLAKSNFQDFSGALHSAEPLIANIGKSQGLSATQMHYLMADLYGLGAQMTQTGDSAQHAFELIGHATSKMLGPTASMRAMMGSLGLDAQDVTDHLGERGVTGTLQLLQQALQAHTKDGMVDVGVHYQSAQASRAEAEAFNALTGPAKAVAEQIKNGSLTYQEWRKSRGGVSKQLTSELGQWDALYSKLTGYNDLIKSGIGDHISYDQALKILTGDQETLQVALQAAGENAGAVNDKIKQIDGSVREADGTVKGYTETTATFNAKMDQFKHSMGAARIEMGEAFLPVMTDVAGALRTTGQFLAEHKGLAEGLTIAVGALGVTWTATKLATLAYKDVLKPLGTAAAWAFNKIGASAGTANTAIAAGGPAAATAAAQVDAAAAEEVAAEGRVRDAALQADAAMDAGHGPAGGAGGGGGGRFSAAWGPLGLAFAGAGLASEAMDHIKEKFPSLGPTLDTLWLHNPASGVGAYNFLFGDGHAGGGPIHGRGPKGVDSVPIWAAPGEHMLTADDVDAMGGHGAVHAFRNALHRQYGGPIGDDDGGPVSRLYQEAQALNGGPYVWGSTDCSGAVSDLVNAALGTSGRMSTATAQNWLAEKGFQPGMGGPGSLNIGWYNGGPGGGHMAATLPDGTHFESGGSHGGIMLGGGAAGAESSEFTNHMHLPLQGFYPDGPAGAAGGMGMFGGGGLGGFGGGGFGGGIPPGATAGTGPGGMPGYYTPNPQRVASAQEQLRHIDAEIAAAEKRRSELKSDAKQSEKDRLDEEIRHLRAERVQEEQRLQQAERGTFHAGHGRGGMGGIGLPVPLADRFGLGKGLPGLAEWAVGFLEDLVLGPMETAVMAGLGGSAGGFGNVGLAQALGPLTNGPLGGVDLASAVGPASGGGGGGGGAPISGPSGGAPATPGWYNDPWFKSGAAPGGSAPGGSAPDWSRQDLVRKYFPAPGSRYNPKTGEWEAPPPGAPAAAPVAPRNPIPGVDYPGLAELPPEIRQWALQRGYIDAYGNYTGPPIPSGPVGTPPTASVPRGPYPGDLDQLPNEGKPGRNWRQGLPVPPPGGYLPGVNPGAVQHHAAGGPSGSDTIPSWLSPGEFVEQPSAVQRYGAPFMDALNQGRVDPSSVRYFGGGGPTDFALTPPPAPAPQPGPKTANPAPGGQPKPPQPGPTLTAAVTPGVPGGANTHQGLQQPGASKEVFGQELPASPGLGLGGGFLGAAESAASQAAGMAASMGSFGGAGGAASSATQMAFQLLNRTAAYGAQDAGILAEGIIETLSLSDSPLSNFANTLPGKLLAGVAGVRPAENNTAGQTKAPLTSDQAGAQGGAGGQGGGGQSFHVSGDVNVHPRNFDDMVNQIADRAQRMSYASAVAQHGDTRG